VRHALRNGFIPVLTFIGLQLTALLGGSVIIEAIFALPGLGTLTIAAINTKDYQVIQGCVLFFGFLVVVMNLLVDLSYGIIDPRLRKA
jgi:peptide/nickel transport system permease protein